MIELAAVFWMSVLLTGVIGLMRGWVREIQVTAAAVLSMFIIEQISPWVWEVLVARTPAELIAADPLGTLRRLVMLKAAIMMILVFFGYEGPMMVQFATRGRAKANKARESIQEGILGLMVGMLNGYLIIGSLWWYIHTGHYPFDWLVSPENFPDSSSAAMISALPLRFLGGGPWLEIMVVVFFVLVIIVII